MDAFWWIGLFVVPAVIIGNTIFHGVRYPYIIIHNLKRYIPLVYKAFIIETIEMIIIAWGLLYFLYEVVVF